LFVGAVLSTEEIIGILLLGGVAIPVNGRCSLGLFGVTCAVSAEIRGATGWHIGQ
jgi:hypothetical protein